MRQGCNSLSVHLVRGGVRQGRIHEGYVEKLMQNRLVMPYAYKHVLYTRPVPRHSWSDSTAT